MHDPQSCTLCPACDCHVHRGDSTCPHCGAALQPSPGLRVPRTAGAVLMGLGLLAGTSCVTAKYGIPDTSYVDEDGDGYTLSEDCDDDNADIHPDATETPGDGTDSNCDGDDDT
ncbi:MAG: hypothetical protein H6739_13400 [Alphaproteobacteria bacterium]|nr:hypothetical protein [Alphaproteobacteria bacterium]